MPEQEQQSNPPVLQPPPPHVLIQYFRYEHLPAYLQNVSKPFCELACKIDSELPTNLEKAMALRKLLEAKDCAVRAVLYQP